MATVAELPCAAKVGLDDALDCVRRGASPLGMESVPLARAGRRILALPVIAQVDAPRRDCAAMDGFAVRSQDLLTQTTRLLMRGESAAGGPVPQPLRPGTAIRVSTGAPMPDGADRVVMREHARVDGDIVHVPLMPGKSHVRVRASDFARGTALLAPGTHIDARAMVVACAADLAAVTVWRQPKLRILANGDELSEPGRAAPHADTIPDSLSEALLLMGRQWGAKPLGISRVKDDAEQLRSAARDALADADVIVLAGGASDGRRDLARCALMPLGLRIQFAGVSMKPGKPLWYGRIGRTHFLGLPGNPTAALTTARLFLAPLLSALSGAAFDRALEWQEMPLLHDVGAAGDRDQVLCGYREGVGARIMDCQEASAQMTLATADLLIERRSGAGGAVAGTRVRCLRF